MRTVQLRAGGIHLPELDLWLDPQRPQTGSGRVVVSHAHSDHVGAHREVIVSAPTARLMRARLGGERIEHLLPFGEPRRFEAGRRCFQITLLPAGHVLGSAMALVEWEGQRLLYTGDFKLRPGRSAEPCAPAPACGCDLLIMEATYGHPRYRFPPVEEVLGEVFRFCHQALRRDETPVLLCYSLGKSQELLAGLAGAGLQILLHHSVHKLTTVYEQLGQHFPAYECYEGGPAHGKVLICPPTAHRAVRRGLGRACVAVLTGWAVESGCRFRYRAEAAFPLSDHADFPELVEFVKQVAPKQILTWHGFAADFAETLRELGYAASPFGEDEQLTLPLGRIRVPPSGGSGR